MCSLPLAPTMSETIVPEKTDEEVLRESLEKPWMFEIIVRRYEVAFLKKGRSILYSHESAEDAVQDTFLKIYKNAHKFKEESGAGFSSWAYRILTNTCLDELDRQKRHKSVGLEFHDLDISARVEFELKGDYSYVKTTLEKMPENLSRFLKLYFFEEKSQREIAKEEGMSEVAVRSRIHRAKKYFKDLMLQII